MSGRDALIQQHRLPEPLYVTRPALPSLEAYTERLRPVWEKRWLANAGDAHQELEQRIAAFHGVEHASLFCNGTIAMLVGIQSLGIASGEVVTTPFTFPATTHTLFWNRLTPVFCDIKPDDYTMDPAKLERSITRETRAILPVHVYGGLCDMDGIEAIAKRHGLPVLYDAAHIFGVRDVNGPPLARGDVSVLSFHATKVFTTAEGGAVIARDAALKRRIDLLKNFGIAGEEQVLSPGINGKMSELNATLGLLNLDGVEAELEGRRAVLRRYRERLTGERGLTLLSEHRGITPNGAYMPVRIDAAAFGRSRDEVHETMRACNVITRKYFFPLCSHFDFYRDLPSARPENLPEAERAAREVLCLPIYGALELPLVDRVCDLLLALRG
ncbi:MAG: aminotransferase class I/II-fold pyridoxal phosphate-dependent enzyme [Candidatus Hydrogenedens sp.]|nr:aminotransferase class I/II-fold pyridoxal phosphate-dependent enzyme [Candidatus Hydrogenedens sp.]